MGNEMTPTMLIKIIFPILLSTCTLAFAKEKPGEKQQNLARDYVLASCIIHAYPNTPLASEAEVWATGIVEQGGGLRYDDYPALAALVKQAPAPLSSQQGLTMRMQNCVEFVRSAHFTSLLRKTLKR